LALVYRHFNTTGSLPRFHVELVRGLSRRGHEVHVFSTAGTTDERLAPAAVFHDVPVVTVAPGRFVARELGSFAWNAARMLERGSFDAIHTRHPSTWIADVLHVHGVFRARHHEGTGRTRFLASQLRHPGNLSRTLIEWRAIRSSRVARFHVDSQLVCDDLERYYRVDPGQITVLPPGVNLDEFRPGDRETARRELRLPDGFLVLFCGHDFGRKGLDRLIDAIALMREGAHLVVVGGGDAAPYMTRARRLGVDAVFLGSRSDPALAYQAADVFVLPTRVDMWGVTVVEAMACGLPAIVTANAGVATAVREGTTGFVLRDAFDVKELAALLDRVSSDPNLRTRMGSAGVDAARPFSWDVHVTRVEQELSGLQS
jgi:glycosyltransferase involved in cell wall biosynthesis